MRTIIMSLAALLMSLSMNAQSVLGAKSIAELVECSTTASNTQSISKSFKSARIGSNQQYVGVYTTEDIAEQGLGVPDAEGNNKIATVLSSDLLRNWVGCKIVGMRFALKSPVGRVKGFISSTDETTYIGQELASAEIRDTEYGWNVVTFSQPYTIKANEDIAVGYTYKQTGRGYSDAYPMSFVKLGAKTKSYLYAKYGGNDYMWYHFPVEDTYGNLSVQIIVEKADVNQEGLFINSIETNKQSYSPGSDGTLTLDLYNNTSKTIRKYTIDITLNDRFITTYRSSESLYSNSSARVDVDFSIPYDLSNGSATLKATIKTIDGFKPEGEPSTLSKQIQIKNKELKQYFIVEEYTGTGCGYCPRGMAGMEKMEHTYGDRFIGIAIHQFNKTDPMYVANYAKLKFTGAPTCIVNRSTSYVDPYYGGLNAISQVDKGKPVLGVDVEGYWEDGLSSVRAKATVESTISANNYNIVFVLVADGLKGNTSNWAQANYLYSDYPSNYNYDRFITPYLYGGKYGSKAFYPTFNDVLIGSSYNAEGYNSAVLGRISSNSATEVNHTVYISAKQAVRDVLRDDKVKIVAFVVDDYGRIVNGGYSFVKHYTTGIKDNNTFHKDVIEIGRYSIDGRKLQAPQKGINIIKYSDGSSKKVVVQ